MTNQNENNPILYKKTPITKSFLSSLKPEERKPIAAFVFKYFREHGFPYPSYSDDELRKDWDNLLKADSSQVISDKSLSTKFLSGIHLFKHFSSNYYHAKKAKKDHSFVEAFNDDGLLKKCIDNRMGITYKEIFNITPAMIKQGLRNSYCCSSASIFNPAIAKYIYDTYTVENGIVYDYAVGFGQRALGAMASSKNLKYIGCDPEENVIKNVNSLAAFINRTDKVDITQSGSEDYCPAKYKNKVCLAFSSPPYFDQENYSENEKQANAKGFDHFINVYWKNTVANINKLLTTDSKFILNVPEYLFKNMKQYIEPHFELNDTLHIQVSRNTSYRTKTNSSEPVYIFTRK